MTEIYEKGGGGGVSGGARFIRLSNPAICRACGRYLKRGRGAFWDAGTITCVPCVRAGRGEAPQDPEEEELLAEEINKEEGKGTGWDRIP